MRAAILLDRKDKEGDVAELLGLYNLCKDFGVLPHAGGLLDQPARVVYLLTQVSNAYAEKETKEAERKRREAKRAGNS
jgi:hypothetical protein